MSNERTYPSLAEALSYSFSKALSQYVPLLKTIAYIFFYVLLELAVIIAAILIGYSIHNFFGLFLQLIAVIYLLVLIVKLDGAFGAALAYLSIGQEHLIGLNKPREIAWKSLKQAFPFFYNALKTGVFLFFGQMLLICPCFIFLTNYVYSPYLFIYEGLKGRQAEQRSIELSRNFGWTMLARTIAILLMAYALMAAAIVFLIKFNLGTIGLILFGLIVLYSGLVQSNFIRKMYLDSVSGSFNSDTKTQIRTRHKVIIALSLMAVVFIYIVIKLILRWKS